MTCEIVRESMCEYLDGLLEGERENQFKQHLAHCPECSEEAEELRNTLSWVKQVGDVTPPANLRQNVLQQLAQEQRTRRRFAPGFSQTVAAAAVFLLLLVGNMVPTQQPFTDMNPAILEYEIKDMEGRKEMTITGAEDVVEEDGYKYNTLESPPETYRSDAIDNSGGSRSRRNYRYLLNVTLLPLFFLLSFLAVKKRQEATP